MKKALSFVACFALALALAGCGSSSTSSTKKTTTTKSNGITVAIDPGHQAQQDLSQEPIGPGATTTKAKVAAGTTGVYTKNTEGEVNLQIALKLQKELKARGYKVVMIRTTQNVNISNKKRAEIANKSGAKIFLRLHCNGSTDHSVKGACAVVPTNKNTYLSKSVITNSQKLSQLVLTGMCGTTSATNRGLEYSDTMSGINWCKIPVTILEMGFMSNKQEDINLSNATYQTKVVKGIANGVDNYFK